MGRKSLDKERITNHPKTDEWLKELLPKLQDQDLAKVNMNQLSKLIGKSKSTVYQYFKTKEEIIDRLVDIKLSEVQDSIVVDTRNSDVLSSYEYFVMKVCQGLDGISIQFLNQLRTAFPMTWTKVEGFMNQVLTFFEGLYQRGMEEEIFRPYPVSMLLAIDEFFMYQFMIDPKRSIEPVETLVRYYMTLRLEGLHT